MANPNTQGSESIIQAEHIGPTKTGDNIEAKRIANYGSDPDNNWQRLKVDASGNLKVVDSSSSSASYNSDIFGYQVIVQPYNQIELRGDDSDWASFVAETNANGGDTTQASGLLNIATSTGTTGSAILASLDSVRYRPGVGIYGAGTAIFTTGVTGANQYFGLSTDTSFTNGLVFGYKGTSFGIRYTRGGSEVSFIAQASWDDPCQGAATSGFTRSGVAETLDPTKNNLYRFEAGLFGFAGWRAQVWSPDNGWITIYTHKHINSGTTPVFTSNTFKMVMSAVKTSGATNVTIKTQCWAAGTGTPLTRLSTAVNDRTLAQTVRSVLAAKKPNGDYANIDATAGGNLKISIQEQEDAGLATEAKQDILIGYVDTVEAGQATTNASLASIDAYRTGATKTPVVATLTTSGDNTIHTPASGKAIRLYWFSALTDPDDSSTTLIKVLIGSTEYYRFYGNMAHYEVFEGAANEVLKVNLAANANVACTFHIEEFTP